MGSAYIHVRELGNVNYKGGPVEIEDLEAGLCKLRAILERGPAILMCMCSNLRRCHRKVAADALAGEGYAVVHLRQAVPVKSGTNERQAALELEVHTPTLGAGHNAPLPNEIQQR